MEQMGEIVAALDAALQGTPLADFYLERKRLVGGNQWSGALLQMIMGGGEPRSGYAFHKGGRRELQFNVGFEEDGAYFRYGVAFSLEPSRDLSDPVEVLAPKIQRFNQIIASFPELSDLIMWHYDDGLRPVGPVTLIPPSWVHNNVFICVGERVALGRDGVTPAMVRRTVQVLNRLFPLYRRVEDKTSVAAPAADSYKVARLCWNLDFWQRPTGPRGKSRNPDTFEAQYGYGHEEWLFDLGTLLNGWKYGFVQPLNQSHDKYAGQRLSLLFYSLDDLSKRRYWVGIIDDAEVLTTSEAQRASKEFRKRGVLDSMRQQVTELGLEPSSLGETGVELVNLRFRPQALRMFDPPVPIPDDVVKSAYYGTFQQVPQAQLDIVKKEGNAAASLVERNLSATKAIRHVYESTVEFDLVQTQWQKRLKDTLKDDLPGMTVDIEVDVGGR